MADRFLLLDYLTRTIIAEMPAVDSFSYSETLNKPGSWTTTIPLNTPISAADLYSSRAVFAFERAGILRWAGPILTARIDVENNAIALSGEGYMNYLRRRVLYVTMQFSGIDQLVIAKDLIDYAQSFGTPSNLGIVTTALTAITTVTRDRTYYSYEKKFIGELIEQLANVRDGFDFRLTPRWSNGPNSTMVIDFGVTYPSYGRPTGYVFDVAAHDVPTIDIDLTRLAFKVSAVGRGTGEDIPSVTLSKPSLIAASALLEDVVSAGDVSETGTLNDYAQRRLDLGSSPLIYPIVVLGTEDIGSFIPGDQVILNGSAGTLDIGGTYRIVEQKLDLPSSGPETLSLTLTPLAAWIE